MLASWLGYVHAKYQSYTGILPPNVGFTLPQLDISVPQLQNPGTINSRTRRIEK